MEWLAPDLGHLATHHKHLIEEGAWLLMQGTKVQTEGKACKQVLIASKTPMIGLRDAKPSSSAPLLTYRRLPAV